MNRNLAMVVAGLVTAFVMVLAVGLLTVGGAFARTTQAAPPTQVAASQAEAQLTADQGAPLPTNVAALQEQVRTYQAELQKAYQDLQAAYDQIQAMNSAQNTTRGFRQRGESNEREFGGSFERSFGGN